MTIFVITSGDILNPNHLHSFPVFYFHLLESNSVGIVLVFRVFIGGKTRKARAFFDDVVDFLVSFVKVIMFGHTWDTYDTYDFLIMFLDTFYSVMHTVFTF